jgi:succinate-semialdehyde dehydrogenase/glutarate-semialdehyde dehydrogenase
MTVHAKPVDRRVVELKDPSLLVGQAYVAGEWIDAPDGKTIPVTDPFDGALILEVPDLGPDIARRAIDKAHAVQKDWAKRTAKERSAILRTWYDLIIANADDLALILTTEQGKPLAEAKGEVISNAAYIEWFAEEAKRIDGDDPPSL